MIEKKTTTTALFIGRFQPLHKGHVHAIRQLLNRYNRVLVAIGSINKRDGKNLYSFSLRRKMIRVVFPTGRVHIVGLRDYLSDRRWVQQVTKHRFDVVVTGNSHVKRCLERYGVERPVFLKRTVYNSTAIRRAMRRGRAWKERVPKEVRALIE